MRFVEIIEGFRALIRKRDRTAVRHDQFSTRRRHRAANAAATQPPRSHSAQARPVAARPAAAANEHAFVCAQSTEQTNLILQRAADHTHPHAGYEPARRDEPAAQAVLKKKDAQRTIIE